MKDKEYININPDGDDRISISNMPPLVGMNDTEMVVPAYNPPVPNRAWTAMRAGKDIDELTEEEKKMLYLGKDDII